jgi:two-component system chemotaxis sensor kinase CheA
VDSTYYLSLFMDEGRERIQQLAELMQALERTPDDRELLNEVFRNVHSFKGMADTMEFADLVALTHAMEGVLDALRRGRLELDPPLTRLMVRCLDALEGRVEAIDDPRKPAAADFAPLETQLAAALARVHPAEVREITVPQPLVHASPVHSESGRTYRIDIVLDAMCYMKSARALVITSSLEMLGAVLDITPSLEELEWDAAGDSFSIVLVTDASAETIAAALTGLSEIASAAITEQDLPAMAHGEVLPLERAERERLEQAAQSGRQAVWIDIAFVPTATNRAVRASMAIATLAEFGAVVRVEPALALLEHEGHDGFRLLFATAEDPATLRECLLPTPEILTVAITPFNDGTPGPVLVAPEHSSGPAPEARVARRSRSLRVEAEHLDGVMDLLGALAIGQNRLMRTLERQGAAERPDVREALDDLGGMTHRLREALMRLRLVPLDMVFNRFPRLVRDLSGDLGKQVTLQTKGGDIPLDRLLVDELGDVLVHLIRNALDHGLETPAERQQVGKPSVCTLLLEARLEGTQALIRVADDGRGVDVERVAARAVENGLLALEEARALPAARLLEVLFQPGFSTAEHATRISGRGVGLDAVKHKVEALGGFVHIDTQPGRGTAFELRFPIPRDFLARAGDAIEARAPREG